MLGRAWPGIAVNVTNVDERSPNPAQRTKRTRNSVEAETDLFA